MEIPLENEIIYDYNGGAVWIKTEHPDCSSSYINEIDEKEIILKDVKPTKTNNIPLSSYVTEPDEKGIIFKDVQSIINAIPTTSSSCEQNLFIKEEEEEEEEEDEDYDSETSYFEGIFSSGKREEEEEVNDDHFFDGKLYVKKEEKEDFDEDDDFEEEELSLNVVDHPLKEEEEENNKEKKLFDKEGSDNSIDIDVGCVSPVMQKRGGGLRRKIKANKKYSEDFYEFLYQKVSGKPNRKHVTKHTKEVVNKQLKSVSNELEKSDEDKVTHRNLSKLPWKRTDVLARAFHNDMEKGRRQILKESFAELQSVIPEIATFTKVSKNQILSSALTEINDLMMEKKSLSKEIYALELENERLRKRFLQDIKRYKQRSHRTSLSHPDQAPISPDMRESTVTASQFFSIIHKINRKKNHENTYTSWLSAPKKRRKKILVLNVLTVYIKYVNTLYNYIY